MLNGSAISRREWIKRAAMTTAAFSGLKLVGCSDRPSGVLTTGAGFGPLVTDPASILDLPTGYAYTVVSQAGEAMDDGLVAGDTFDGMCALAGPAGTIVLIRNHELSHPLFYAGPFGADGSLAASVDPALIYDKGNGQPLPGGTTTLVLDAATLAVQSRRQSLMGTVRNCAGGVTPWNSWLSCEEDTTLPGPNHEESHGWVFEVPLSSTTTPAAPIPLKQLGRFRHEAAAVHPATGIVYLTEDRGDGLFYRFVPAKYGDLVSPGRLEALAITGLPAANTNTGFKVGDPYDVNWISLSEREAPLDDLRARGKEAGAATFVRGEGIWFGTGLYFAATSGGAKGFGQIWHYEPSIHEGTESEAAQPGRITLYAESADLAVSQMIDNLTVTPWGELMACEDKVLAPGNPDNRLLVVNRFGESFTFARLHGASEIAGACFSPDGSTLFVNRYAPGRTLAIRGPWPSD